MALVLADRVLETTGVSGTGNANLNGAQANYQPFSVIGDGSTTYYTIVDNTNNSWEVGIGTYVLAGNYISRDTVLSSSNGGALVYFGSGDKDIFLDLPSEELNLNPGDVFGPTSAVANNFAAFNMTTGKLIKDSGYNASSFATAAQGALADTAVQPGDLGTAAYLDAGSANGVATLDAGGKVPTSQIPQMGDLNYQGTWNASTNTPTLTSSAGTKGFYYVVSVAGSTNLNGITDWKVGDWAVFNGSVWEKIDNTDAVTSVNGYTGTVVLTTTDIAEGTNEYFTTAKARASVSAGTGISYDSGTGVITNSAPDQTVVLTDGTAIDVTGTYPSFTITNTAPDQVVALTGAGTTSITGTYPNFTITSNDEFDGDVVGPASATDNAIARFDTTTGKLIQNSVVTIDDSGNIIGANSISTIDYAQLDTTAAASIALGKLRWNVDTATAAFGIIDGATEVNIGQQMYAYVTNAESVTITAGQAVYLYQATGNRASVKLAYNTGDATSAKTLGLVTADITAGATGFVTTQGVLAKLNTGSFAEGDTLYLGATAGSLTATKPSAPNHLVYIGVVERANNGNGQIYVRPQNGYELNEIHDVKITSPANGQTILYDASTSLWKNANLTAGTGISITNGAASATITNSAPDQTVAITGAGGAVVTGTYPNFTITTPSGTVTSVTGTAPIASTGGATPAISISQATTSTDGYLSSTDWNTFNNKQPAGSYLTTVTASTPLSGSGTVGSPLVIAQATTSTSGYLSSTDWNTFNNKGSGTVTSVTGTAPVVSSGGATPAISMAAATTSVDGYLTSTDWNTFNGKYSTGGALGTPSSGTLTNCTGYTYANLSGTVPTWNQDTTGKSAKTDALNSATTVVNVSSSAAPTTGQVLTATSSTAATWQTPTSGGGFPSGTRMSFQQTSAPTGWTKDTTAAIDDSALRFVTGTASSGGSVAFSTAFTSQAVSGTVGSTGAFTLTSSEIPGHNHMQGRASEALGIVYGRGPTTGAQRDSLVTNTQNLPYTSTTGGGGSHSHSGGSFTGTAINLAVKYYDFIIASKD